MRVDRVYVLTALGLIALLVLVVVNAPRLSRLLTRTVPGEEGGDDAAATVAPAAEGEAPVEQKISVKLFFLAPDQPALLIEDREVGYSGDLSQQVRTVVEELVKGSQKGLGPPLAPETRVIDTFVTAAGVAYVDLSKEASAKHPGGSKNELLTVYAIVNSLTSNFPAIKRVQILVDDRQAATLAGHVDLTRPLTSDMTLLVGAAPSPVPAPAATPAAAAPPS